MTRLFVLSLLVACTDDVVPEPDTTFTVSSTQLSLGPIACGMKASKFVRVDNPSDHDVELAINADHPDLEVQSELAIPAGGSVSLAITGNIFKPSASGTVTLTGDDHAVSIAIGMTGIGVPVTFEPPILDFGTVLPDTVKELPLKVTLGAEANFALDLVLGPASTPRFEIVGASSVRLHHDAPTATFTLRYLSSTTPFEHDGTLPITVNGAGSCTPRAVELTGTTVP